MKGLIQDLASFPALVWKMFRYPGGVTPRKLPYGPDPAQYFLDFAPTPEKDRGLVVVYLHGGGWDKGSPAFFTFIGQRLAREGYRCVMPGYRLVPKYRFPAQIEDVTAGTKAALRHLEKQGMDTARTVVVGSSAGGQLGALLCYTGELAGRFVGFAGLGGPYRFDLDPPLSLNVLGARLLDGGDPVTAQPGLLLDRQSPKTPMLLIHGLEDGVVGFPCGMDFYRRALSLNIPATLYLPETGKDSHSDYVVGCFLEKRETCGTLNALLTWLEGLAERGPEPFVPETV